ncbi:hypothetical protein FSP39_013268 [Pinctada imbricata]|uniref:Uncharacterized protein n=1 Tax=Pinctada imbricata TaxID=66713 RepID=A0AA89BKM5_PINIB|nr:hypothetical protein FSP39_013268 [Pinctada imbricata]
MTKSETSEQEIATVIEILERKLGILRELDSSILTVTDPNQMEKEIFSSDDFNVKLELQIRKYKDEFYDRLSRTMVAKYITNQYVHPIARKKYTITNLMVDRPCYFITWKVAYYLQGEVAAGFREVVS